MEGQQLGDSCEFSGKKSVRGGEEGVFVEGWLRVAVNGCGVGWVATIPPLRAANGAALRSG